MIITTEERQDIIKEIEHAFGDAGLIWSDIAQENRPKFRENLEIPLGIIKERYGCSDEEFKALIVEVATEIGALDAYNWAYGKLTIEQAEIIRIKRSIAHAFDDASMNMDGKTEAANQRKYRKMLEMHTNIIPEFHDISNEELQKLVLEVAEEIGAKEAYDWAYGTEPS